MTTNVATHQEDLDFALSLCREMTDDFRFTVEDIDAEMMRGATEYARQYTGTFDFMREMHIRALRTWLTAGQAKGVLNCLMAQVRRERQAALPRETVDFTGLRAMFAKAAQALKSPRITLSLDGQPILIRLNTRGQHVGAIGFSSGETWYGRVETDGSLTATRAMGAGVRGLIQELSDDPVAAARRHAHLTGNCCFCNRKLDDARSTAAGYGPVCADNYGLPWGQD